MNFALAVACWLMVLIPPQLWARRIARQATTSDAKIAAASVLVAAAWGVGPWLIVLIGGYRVSIWVMVGLSGIIFAANAYFAIRTLKILRSRARPSPIDRP